MEIRNLKLKLLKYIYIYIYEQKSQLTQWTLKLKNKPRTRYADYRDCNFKKLECLGSTSTALNTYFTYKSPF